MVMTFNIQQVKGELHCDIIMLCKSTFLAITQLHISETEEETFSQILN